MSDLMLLDTLRMPPDCWIDYEFDKNQRHRRYLEAADRIEEQQKAIRELLDEMGNFVNALHEEDGKIVVSEHVDLDAKYEELYNKYKEL